MSSPKKTYTYRIIIHFRGDLIIDRIFVELLQNTVFIAINVYTRTKGKQYLTPIRKSLHEQ